MTSLFRCSVCGAPLFREEHQCRCEHRHSFDISREGYVYLLAPNEKHSANPGDDRRMAKARHTFLEKGYYASLRDTLCREISARAGKNAVFLDAGCGEGYYTCSVFRSLRDLSLSPRCAGTDISKEILRIAAKRDREMEFAVASSYRLPLADESVDLLLDCFSPLALDEFRRVLRPGGFFFYAVPGAGHLWSLKKILYDDPYLNEEKETPYEGFSYDAIVPVDSSVTLPSQEDIASLFRMTPYYWKTPKKGSDRLAVLNTLTTEISFRIHIFRKNKD